MQDKYAKYARQLTGEWEENTGISVSIFLVNHIYLLILPFIMKSSIIQKNRIV